MGLLDWQKSIIRNRKTFIAEVDCFWHGPEDRGGAYRICFECDHVFRTERQLRREHRRLLWTFSHQLWLKSFLTPTSEIWSCPLCTHDWAR